MNHNKKLESTLKSQAGSEAPVDSAWAETYAEGIALIENALVVLSDLSRNRSYIYRGRFAKNFNLSEKSVENTIWEEEILHLIPADDREKKYLYELKYFQFLQQIPTSQLRDYYLVNTLRMQTLSGKLINILHRTYYLYADDDRAIAFGLCIYQQAPLNGSVAPEIVNSLTGVRHPIDIGDTKILTRRELQILSIIREGHTSKEVSELLHISRNTVSRHRQEIISKLGTRNIIEAIKVCETIGLL